MGPFPAIASGLHKYFTFSGRASRSELWYFLLFYCIALVAAAVLDGVLRMPVTDEGYGLLLAATALVLLLPCWSAQVRRLHDTDRSGWWVWLVLIPVVGAVILLIWYCREGTNGDNRFGSNPIVGPTERGIVVPTRMPSVTERAEQLAKLKALLDAGTINREEFDRMKAQALSS